MAFGKKFDFTGLSEETGYSLFPANLEDEPLVLFRAMAMAEFQSVSKQGFQIGHAGKVYFATKSKDTLIYAFKHGNPLPNDSYVVAVRFKEIDTPTLFIPEDDIYYQWYNVSDEHEPVGYCVIPSGTWHV